MAKETKRRYDASGRQAQAQQTRQAILAVTRNLVESEGFDKVTIARLAQEAGVSASTVYGLFKSKAGILEALIDEALPQATFDALVFDSKQEAAAEVRMAIAAKIARQVYDAEREVMAILRGAPMLAPKLKEMEEFREGRRLERQAETVERLAREGALRADLTHAEARDVFWALTGRDLYRQLVMDRGWDADRYEAWLTQQLRMALLTP